MIIRWFNIYWVWFKFFSSSFIDENILCVFFSESWFLIDFLARFYLNEILDHHYSNATSTFFSFKTNYSNFSSIDVVEIISRVIRFADWINHENFLPTQLILPINQHPAILEHVFFLNNTWPERPSPTLTIIPTPTKSTPNKKKTKAHPKSSD